MKTVCKFILGVLTFLVFNTVSAKEPSNLLTDLRHAGSAYRTVLLDKGWKPVIMCPHNKQPEIYNCSSGMQCTAFWKKDGKFLSVATNGGVTGEQHRRVHFAEPTTLSNVQEEIKNSPTCERFEDGFM